MNKGNCDCRKIKLSDFEVQYINEKVKEDWTPDVIIERKEKSISCSVRIFYRKFKSGEFNQCDLPMQGKRKPNGHQEKCWKQSFKRNIRDRDNDHPNYQKKLGHIESDTIIGHQHKSTIITFLERVSKCIIALKLNGLKTVDIEKSLNLTKQTILKC